MGVADWVQGLEDRVKRLETWAGPGQIEALVQGQQAIGADLAKIQIIIDRHERILIDLRQDFSGPKPDVTTLKTDVTDLKTDVTDLKTDVNAVRADVALLKADIVTVKTDVAGLKEDMGEVKETLREILRRLRGHPAPN